MQPFAFSSLVLFSTDPFISTHLWLSTYCVPAVSVTLGVLPHGVDILHMSTTMIKLHIPARSLGP